MIMNYIISARTDVGLTKDTNQDSLSVKVINTSQGRMAFAILCDGMGGLEKGEVASATVVHAFHNWVMAELPHLCLGQLQDAVLRQQWEKIIHDQNESIKAYGARQGVRLGTTIVVMLLTDQRYYIMNVGDSRAYEIADTLTQLTADQTFVAREVSLGNMTLEQAQKDPRRSVLLQCVGASDSVFPDFFCGETKENAIYMLCSDGFRHEITEQELLEGFYPSRMLNEEELNKAADQLIALNKQRQESDNISVALIRTF